MAGCNADFGLPRLSCLLAENCALTNMELFACTHLELLVCRLETALFSRLYVPCPTNP